MNNIAPSKSERKSTKLQPEIFDDRFGLGLSEAVIKRGPNTDSLLDFQQKNSTKTSIPLNHRYFEDRIAHERLLLKEYPTNIKLLNRVGDIYLANGKPDKARQYFNRAFQLDTDNVTTAFKLATVFMMLGKPDKADQVLKMLDETSGQILQMRAVTNLVLENFDVAKDLLGRIRKSYKNYFETINTVGLIQLLEKDFTAARASFEAALAHNPLYTPAKNNLAVVYVNLGKPELAIKQYRSVIVDDPGYVISYNNLFNLLVDKGEIESAYDLMLSAQHLATPDNEIQFRIAWSQMRLGRFKEAIESYEKVLKMLPENSNTLNNIAFCYQNLSQPAQAVAYFQRAIRGKNATLLPARNLMLLHDALGEYRQSRDLARQILRIDDNDPFALTYYGSQLIEEEKYDEAFEVLLKAYESKPSTVSLYVSLLFLYADIFPDFAKGMEVADYVLGSKLPIDDTDQVYNNYVHLLLVNGKVDEASRYIDKLDSEHPVSLSTRALFQLMSGNPDQAKQLFDEAIAKTIERLKDKIVQRRHYDFGNYYLKKKERRKAIAEYEAVVDIGDKGFGYVLKDARDKLESLEKPA